MPMGLLSCKAHPKQTGKHHIYSHNTKSLRPPMTFHCICTLPLPNSFYFCRMCFILCLSIETLPTKQLIHHKCKKTSFTLSFQYFVRFPLFFIKASILRGMLTMRLQQYCDVLFESIQFLSYYLFIQFIHSYNFYSILTYYLSPYSSILVGC